MLENPEAETRWYFKYFLGRNHDNYLTYLTAAGNRELVRPAIPMRNFTFRCRNASFVYPRRLMPLCRLCYPSWPRLCRAAWTTNRLAPSSGANRSDILFCNPTVQGSERLIIPWKGKAPELKRIFLEFGRGVHLLGLC
jgi:hypothetical protein